MKLAFPSNEFDEAVAAVCHGPASDEQMRALNDLLRSNDKARDEYILRVEIHSRLASKPNLFVRAHVDDVSSDKIVMPLLKRANSFVLRDSIELRISRLTFLPSCPR